ncbi:Transcriptional regulator WhiB [Rhodococcus sp. RD6.2]|jgi:hypothetical protein|uniref:WhiB family transcriptional regulator n=1 Tax=unclassified Rhodococcus (in: high G+C Gram-positive bacteria) TaxID=192944 RepID=UPI00063B5B85|nr:MULTISPECIES: WhiB family transcriptional regulator [unclassified Rhodococcus (in: high G+C Gram-positive bacteria)]CRK49487.1 Transcriptional regulator WhiB [Rhodococcus sp. RD6.2]
MTTSTFVDDPTRWRDAACRDDPNPERWFPFPSDDFTHARDVCNGCPIRLQCTHFAVSTGQSGVWGGMEFDRGRVRR